MMLVRFVSAMVLVSSCLSEETQQKSIDAGPNPLACDYEEIRGNWIFEEGDAGYDKTINCMTTGKVAKRSKILLEYPKDAYDEFGNVGFWTMVDSLGFEVVIHGRSYFAYLKFKSTKNGREIRYCNETILGSSHNVLGTDWSCFFGRRVSPSSSPSPKALEEVLDRDIRSTNHDLTSKELQSRLYVTDQDMVESINAAQSSWTAASYDEYDTMTVDEMLSRAGYRFQRKNRAATPAPITKEQERMGASLPDSFDWRNVKGMNHISPVRDQGKCGSCYAFTSAAMNEARRSIYKNGTEKVIFSVQDVVDCTFYSLACDGGSSYAIGGRYAKDYGMVEESCNPYKGVEGKSCGTKTSCQRYYFTGYEYIGGYYGACNEELMKTALVYYGPLAIAIKVNEDLMFYKSGIYSPTGISSRFNPFVEVDHAVLLIGYGVDKAHGKYWIIKNSWGPNWGDKGYFRLPRGTNVCGVESSAMHSFPIF